MVPNNALMGYFIPRLDTHLFDLGPTSKIKVKGVTLSSQVDPSRLIQGLR
jgi:hypothetical protein